MLPFQVGFERLLTSHKCHCSHPVQIHDSKHPLSLVVMALGQWSPLQSEKSASLPRNGGPTWPENRSLSPFVHQGLSTAKPRSSHAICTLLPTFYPPVSTLHYLCFTMLPVSTLSTLHCASSIYIIYASLCLQYLHYLCFTMLPVSTLSMFHCAASIYIIYASLCCQYLHYLCFTVLPVSTLSVLHHIVPIDITS